MMRTRQQIEGGIDVGERACIECQGHVAVVGIRVQGVGAKSVGAVAPLAVGQQVGEFRGRQWQGRLAGRCALDRLRSVAGEIRSAVAVAGT